MYTEYYQDWDHVIEDSERTVDMPDSSDPEERLLDLECELLDTSNWSSISIRSLLIRSAKRLSYYEWDGVDWQQISRVAA